MDPSKIVGEAGHDSVGSWTTGIRVGEGRDAVCRRCICAGCAYIGAACHVKVDRDAGQTPTGTVGDLGCDCRRSANWESTVQQLPSWAGPSSNAVCGNPAGEAVRVEGLVDDVVEGLLVPSVGAECYGIVLAIVDGQTA